MNKTYKIQPPRNKEAQNIRTNIKDGTIEVEVELNEKWEPRDGDICYCSRTYSDVSEKWECIIIYGEINRPSLCKKNGEGWKHSCYSNWIYNSIRPATDSEKQLLFDALAKQGKMWDTQKKQVVDLPRWRAEKEESYFHVFIDPVIQMQVIHATDFRYYADEKRYQSGNYFKTEEAAEKVAEQIREIFKNSKAE